MHKAYALFDFDGTLIPGDSFLLFCRYAYKQGACTAAQLRAGLWGGLRYLLRLSTPEQSKMAALAFLQGRTVAEVYALSSGFCKDVLLPRIYPEARRALDIHRQEGREIFLVTASPSFYFEPLKGELGIGQIIGTRMDVTEESIYTGLVSGENCKGVQKPLRLAEYLAATGNRLQYDASYAYGDSPSDFPLLQLCAHKVAVNARRGLRRQLRKAEGAVFVRWHP